MKAQEPESPAHVRLARTVDELTGAAHPFWKADVVADSVGPHGVRLTTLALKFPRSVLVEFNTHRMLSRNASSRRAIPTARILEAVSTYPYFPDFRSNQKGMSAGEPLVGPARVSAQAAWLDALTHALHISSQLSDMGVQKSWPGWLLEPYSFVDVVVSATDFGNFLLQRDHPSAQPEMETIAKLIKKALAASSPTELGWREWHLPFITEQDRAQWSDNESLKRISAARSARVSYVNHEGLRDPQQDMELYFRLIGAAPKHLCYDDKTEVMTNTGFKLFKDVTSSDKLVAVDIQNMTGTFEVPVALTQRSYTGPMFSMSSQKLDAVVTPTHRMVTRKLLNNRNGKRGADRFSPWGFEVAESLTKKSRIFSPTCYVDRPGVDMNTYGLSRDNFLKLIGFFIGDGSVLTSKSITFNIRKQRKLSYLEQIATGCTHKTSTYTRVSCDGLGKFMMSCYDSDGNKIIPFELSDLSPTDVLNLFDGLRNSDGSIRKRTWTYSSCSVPLVRQIQEFASTIGIHTSVTATRLPPPQHDSFRINFSKKTQHRFETNQRGRGYTCRAEMTQYDGMVYCATVSTGALLVRRNGKTMVSGNSPFEHQATPVNWHDGDDIAYVGNFKGWMQMRKEIGGERGE